MGEPLFRPFEEMSADDYRAVGFASGLEIHQQLLTARKLFCRCPAGMYNDRYHAEILRHMRPTLSELGEYDGTALMEFKTKKEIIYRIHRDTVCTYEMDDTPPFPINEEALDIALGIGMMFDCSIVDELHIARKQYLDGSIPTGFQRTAIFGLDGTLPFRDRSIRVVQMSIEEDSCREVSDAGHRRVYLTDRLGMPLIETVTGPDMRTPREVAEVAQLCRWMTRSTGSVRTGIGAARQDVNVSVTGGTRIEIKGVPRIPHIPLLTYNEAKRQWNLLRLREELRRRGIAPDSFSAHTQDVTKHLRKTRFTPVSDALEAGLEVACVALRGFRGALRWETQTGTYFSREIADRVRVIACLTTLPNIIHSDSPGETIASSEWQAVRKALSATQDDTLVLVWGGHDDVKMGAQEIVIRAREATVGIPSETRQALRDGTDGFERILPGADRMYPDTDLPPKGITEGRLANIRTSLPRDFWGREGRYHAAGVPDDLVQPLAISPLAPLFERATHEMHLGAGMAARILIQYPKRLRREGIPVDRLQEGMWEEILQACASGRLAKDGVYDVMKEAARRGLFSQNLLPPPCTDGQLDGTIARSVDEVKQMRVRRPERMPAIVMGRAMKELRGRVDGARVAELVRTMVG
jgi:glutamyl-tRNA(Gln) amidotransferase subunit E